MAANTATTKKDTQPKDGIIPALSEERAKALKSTFEQIDKQCGKGSVMLLGQKPNLNVETISTGSILVDDALGVGGLPRGRVVEIFGPEASGKTTLTLHVIAQAQLAGGVCAFIDAEHAMDPTYAERVGIDINNLIISQPDYGEQALDIAEMLVRSNAVDLVVVDSVAALVPKAELEGDMGDHHVGLQARLMSQALRKLTAIVSKSRACLVFINQVRSKINAMPFGDKETTTGGNALKFYASLRLDVRRIGALKKNDKHFGNRVLIKVVKNKLAPPFKRIEVDLIFGKGISQELSLLDAAIEHGIIKQSGAWFTLGDEKLGQGRDNCHKRLEEDKKLYQEIFNQVKEKMKEKS
ncbi:MAG: recombinase RecA [Epsilonproteobacteria bacterium]|nr:recombinase RecA [Campylobacterota bacterium]